MTWFLRREFKILIDNYGLHKSERIQESKGVLLVRGKQTC